VMQEITYQVSYLSWGVKDPLLHDIFLECNHSLCELMVDGRLHCVQQNVQPVLHLPHTQTRVVKVYILPIFASPPHSSYSSEGDLILQ